MALMSKAMPAATTNPKPYQASFCKMVRILSNVLAAQNTGSFGKRMGLESGRHHVELGAVEEDANTEVGEVGQASRVGFDVLDQRVEAFAHRIGDLV